VSFSALEERLLERSLDWLERNRQFEAQRKTAEMRDAMDRVLALKRDHFRLLSEGCARAAQPLPLPLRALRELRQ